MATIAIGWSARVLLAVVFFVSGASKVLTHVTIAPNLPSWLVFLQGQPQYGVLGVAEMAVAILILTRAHRLAAWLTFSFTSTFACVFLYLLATGRGAASCACFGNRNMPLAQHIGLLLSMLVLSVVCLVPQSAQPITTSPQRNK